MMRLHVLDHRPSQSEGVWRPRTPPPCTAERRILPLATSPRSGIGTLRALAIHHRNAPLPLLERVALVAAQREALHARLRAHGIEAVALSTCHRSELYYRAHTRDD